MLEASTGNVFQMYMKLKQANFQSVAFFQCRIVVIHHFIYCSQLKQFSTNLNDKLQLVITVDSSRLVWFVAGFHILHARLAAWRSSDIRTLDEIL